MAHPHLAEGFNRGLEPQFCGSGTNSSQCCYFTLSSYLLISQLIKAELHTRSFRVKDLGSNSCLATYWMSNLRQVTVPF